MDWGLCGESNRWGKKAIWRHKGSGSTTAGWYDACWNSRIDVQRARKDILGYAGGYRRQCEWSCKFQRWGGLGRWGWWRDWAGQFWAKMMILAGWWAQSPKPSSSAWRGFGRSRWSSTNWLNQDGRMQPTASVNKIQSTAPLNWGFRLSFSRKQMMMLRHLHQQHLGSWWRVLTLSPEYCKGCKGLLDQEVVILGYVRWCGSLNRAYLVVCQLQSPIRHRC